MKNSKIMDDIHNNKYKLKVENLRSDKWLTVILDSNQWRGGGPVAYGVEEWLL